MSFACGFLVFATPVVSESLSLALFLNRGIYLPIKLGDYVTIGKGSVVKASQIGSCVEIGEGCVIGDRAIIKSCVRAQPTLVEMHGSVFCERAV